VIRVDVRWIDSGTAYSDGQWEHRDKIMKSATLAEVSTVGWLMGEDDYAYFVALNHIPGTDSFYGAQVIAKSAVTSITRLRARTLVGTGLGDEEDEG
jgi:hypothetical protein